MLADRLRRWPNIKPTLVQRLLPAGIDRSSRFVEHSYQPKLNLLLPCRSKLQGVGSFATYMYIIFISKARRPSWFNHVAAQKLN